MKTETRRLRDYLLFNSKTGLEMWHIKYEVERRIALGISTVWAERKRNKLISVKCTINLPKRVTREK